MAVKYDYKEALKLVRTIVADYISIEADKISENMNISAISEQVACRIAIETDSTISVSDRFNITVSKFAKMISE